jgi:hypothetical protein
MINLDDDNILNVYQFGSRVYGSDSINSDFDYIYVLKEYVESNDINIHHYTTQQFQALLDKHDIQMLECFFLSDKYKHKEKVKFHFNLDKGKLRTAISTISSTSWVKGKKKLIVMGDYDKWLAIKSVFHSLRILDFGIQIAQHSKIINYSSMNYVLVDLINLSKEFDKVDLWEKIESKYKKVYLEKGSIFKAACPKILMEKASIKEDLIKIFEENKCYTKEVANAKLINKLVEYINGL